jgi:hypothetical protein
MPLQHAKQKSQLELGTGRVGGPKFQIAPGPEQRTVEHVNGGDLLSSGLMGLPDFWAWKITALGTLLALLLASRSGQMFQRVQIVCAEM